MPDRTRAGRLVAALVAAVLLVGAGRVASQASAATSVVSTAGSTSVLTTPATPRPLRLRESAVERIARASGAIRSWRRDHPVKDVRINPNRVDRTWTVDYLGADRTVHSQVIVDDATGRITEVRTGPQVAWQMARGYPGAFGRAVTKPVVWGLLLAAFLLPLIRWRRPVSVHTLDLLMLCAFTVSLVWFNRGEIAVSVPLSYPPLVYLFVRLLGIGLGVGLGRRDRPPDPVSGVVARRGQVPRIDSPLPTWVLVSVLLFVMGLRLGLNAFDSNVIDVGYAGVIGADRIADGQTPYGTFPSDCSQCDTYGPLTYLVYVPFEQIMPWSGRWDDLPAAHGAAVVFDLAALLAMVVLGWRLGGRRLAAGLGLAWAAYPFTAYALESNSNDSLVAALLAWGLVVAHRPVGRGMAIGLAALAKFVPAILLFLWLRHPFPRSTARRRWPAYAGGLAIAVAVAAWPILLDGMDGLRRFWSRTLEYQIGRDSPFSIWGMHPGLRPAQIALEVALIVGAVVIAARPRELDIRRFAALSGALLVGLQIAMPHWFYLYIPWFVPFAAVALIPHWSRSAGPAGPPRPPRAPSPVVVGEPVT